MTDLTQALVELRRVTPPSSPWEAGDFGVGSSPVDYHIATIINAVLSGDLIPVQCCMCGKTGISIREGDGGPECQLDDGRWTCSRECWDRATGDLIPRADADLAELATLRAQVERLTVKPLLFSELVDGGCMGRPHPFQYFITQNHNGRFLCHWDETWHDTLPEAQAHAQKDYQIAALTEGAAP